ncbi:ABC transporter permease [Streptomyces gilvifuscus]|uniref:ABC transporter permease n=1 Tax=Streptomyces gilvifuscus TaxID=1550617 RepID=A0ABT5FYL3_9ACTN|nr:ABC transporter permease [Streptomyces gilvifuscus]MDC2957541.1 ABC transporter permease [Streptomyces gilvifuscus]
MNALVLAPAGRRLRALARAELTLLGRNRSAVATALLVPLALPFSVRPALDGMNLERSGLNAGTVMLTAAIGFAFLFSVYTGLVGAFVARREELVLKRLRTGELGDTEILAGTALPAACLGLAQSLVLTLGCLLFLDAKAPRAPYLTVLGVLAGLALCAALAALTASFTRTVESAQVTALPLVFVSMMGSGIAIPAAALPDRLASVCALLPLSPAVRLVSGGFTGRLGATEALASVAIALAWLVAAVFAVRRWFRWEPRR